MNPTLALLERELDALKTSIAGTMPSNEPINIAHGNWSFPGVTRDDLLSYATTLIELIHRKPDISVVENEPILADYIRRLVFLKGNTIPHLWTSNAGLAAMSYISTLESLKILLEKTLDPDDLEKIEARVSEANQNLKLITKPLRAIEAKLLDINARSVNIDEKVNSIEQAHETANQLPTDLETLKESRKTLDKLLKDSNLHSSEIEKALNNVIEMQAAMELKNKEASAIIARCDSAYRAITSQGLASAFDQRSKKLNQSMWIWVFGLILSLALGFQIGSGQLHNLSSTIENIATNHPAKIWIDLILTLLSIGAPVWFAWLSTKQIGQRFRLAEDYGYKSSISTAYEGYRREAELIDPSFQARLFSTALSRLDEVPLRLVEPDTHGSPWHELANSNSIKDAFRSVPNFAEKVLNLANNALAKNKSSE